MNGEYTLRDHHPGSPHYGGRVVSSSSSGSLLRKLTSLTKRSKSQPLLSTRYSTPQSSSQRATSQAHPPPPPPPQPTASSSTPHLLSPDRMALAAAQTASLKANATTSITTNANTARPVTGTRRRATTPAQAPVFSSIPVQHTTAAKTPLVVQVEIHFPGLDSRPIYVHEYASSSDLTVTNRLFKGLLRRLHHCSTELITRKDSRATKPQRRQGHDQSSNKPLRYEIHFRILRQDTGLWTERTFYSYQRQDLASSDAHEVILATHRMVGLFLRRHDPSFHWTDVPSTETAAFPPPPEEPELVPHTVGHPLPLSCIPQSRFLEESQSFDFSPGYAINLTFRSRCHGRKQYEWKRVINLQSKQNAPLNLALAENLLWATFGSVNDFLTARREAFLEEHKSCDFLEGVVSCQHFGEDALDIELGVENKLGPTFDHLTRSIQSKLGLFRDPDARDCLDFFRAIHGQLVHSRDSADTQINALPDFDLRILTLCSPTWSVENPARFVLGTPSSYSRRTVEAMLERVQTGVSDVLRNRDCTIHLVAYKRGHLILDKALIARPLPPRPALFPMPAVFEPADTIIARLKERIHRDLNAVCKDTCSLDGISESAGDEEFPQNNTNTSDALPESPSSPLLVPGAFEQTIILEDPAAVDEEPAVPAPRVVELPDDVFVDALEQPSPVPTPRPTSAAGARRRAFPLIPEKFILPHSRSSSGVTFASAQQTVEEVVEEVEVPVEVEAPIEAVQTPAKEPVEPVKPVEVAEPVEVVEIPIEASAEVPIETVKAIETPVDTPAEESVEAVEIVKAVEAVEAVEVAKMPLETPVETLDETPAKEPVDTVEAVKTTEAVEIIEVTEAVVAPAEVEIPAETAVETPIEEAVEAVETVEIAEVVDSVDAPAEIPVETLAGTPAEGVVEFADAPVEAFEDVDTVDAQVNAIDARVIAIDTRVGAIDALVDAIDSFLNSPVEVEDEAPLDMTVGAVEEIEATEVADAAVEIPAEAPVEADALVDAPVEDVEEVVSASEELKVKPTVDNTEIEAPVANDLVAEEPAFTEPEQPIPEVDFVSEPEQDLEEPVPVLTAELEFEPEAVDGDDDDDTRSSIGGYTFPEMAEPAYKATMPEPVEEPAQPIVLDSPPMFVNFDDEEEYDDLENLPPVELRFDDNSPTIGTPLETILEYESEEDIELAFDLPSYGEFVPPQDDFSLFETTPQATPNRAEFTFESESDMNEEEESFASSSAPSQHSHDHDESFIANTTALTAVSSNCTRPSTPSLSLSSGDINSPQTSFLDTPSIGREAHAAILSCFDSEGAVRFDFRRAAYGYEAESEHGHSESVDNINDHNSHDHSPFEFHGVQKKPSHNLLADNRDLFGQSLAVPPATISSHHAELVSESESSPTEVCITDNNTDNTKDINMDQLLKFDDDDFELNTSAPGSPIFRTRGLRFKDSFEEFAMTKPTLDLDGYADLMADDDDSDRLSTSSRVEAVEAIVYEEQDEQPAEKVVVDGDLCQDNQPQTLGQPEVDGLPDIQEHDEVTAIEPELDVGPEAVNELDDEPAAEPVTEPVIESADEYAMETTVEPVAEIEEKEQPTSTPDVNFQDVAASVPLPDVDDLDLVSEEAVVEAEAPLVVETEADLEAIVEDASKNVDAIIEAPSEATIDIPVEVPAEVPVEALAETVTDEQHEPDPVSVEHVELAPSFPIEAVFESLIAPELDDAKEIQEETLAVSSPVEGTVKGTVEETVEEPQQWLTLTVPETEVPVETITEAEPELVSPITPSSDLEEPKGLLAAEDDEVIEVAEEPVQVEVQEDAAAETVEQTAVSEPIAEVVSPPQDAPTEEPEVEVLPAVADEQSLIDAPIDEPVSTVDVTKEVPTLDATPEEVLPEADLNATSNLAKEEPGQPTETADVTDELSELDNAATPGIVDISKVEVEVVEEPATPAVVDISEVDAELVEEPTPVLQVPAVEDTVELGVPADLVPVAQAVVAIAESLPVPEVPEVPAEMKSLSLDSALRSAPLVQAVEVQEKATDKSLISISDLKTVAPPAPKRLVSWSLPRSGFVGLNETRQFKIGLRGALTSSHAFDDVLSSMKKRQPATSAAVPTTEEAEDDVSSLPQPQTISKSIERRVRSEAVSSKSELAPSKKSKRSRAATVSTNEASGEASSTTQDNMLPRFMVAFASMAIVSQMINKSA